MKKIKNNVLTYLAIFICCVLALILVNFFSISALLFSQQNLVKIDQDKIRREIEKMGDNSSLSAEIKDQIKKNESFVMFLNDNGDISFSENLPEELKKHYTLKDVAKFTRYYLEDYPVQTYIEDGGLLVIGQAKESVWKYNLVYSTELIQKLVGLLPLLLIGNMLILIILPLIIQKKLLGKREIERTEWIAGVSHDIRTPLTLIMGHADQIRNDPFSLSNQEKAVLIENQANRIKNLVANLNLSSKLDFSMKKFEKTEIKLSSKLRKIIVDIVNQDFDQKYQFNLEIDEDIKDMTIIANEGLFQRMIENLVNNSIIHNPKGCEINIILKKSEQKPKKVVIEILDKGKGVTEETLQYLNDTKTKKILTNQEHGIGLRIVKQITNYYHWKIEFAGKKNVGFEVRIEL